MAPLPSPTTTGIALASSYVSPPTSTHIVYLDKRFDVGGALQTGVKAVQTGVNAAGTVAQNVPVGEIKDTVAKTVKGAVQTLDNAVDLGAKVAQLQLKLLQNFLAEFVRARFPEYKTEVIFGCIGFAILCLFSLYGMFHCCFDCVKRCGGHKRYKKFVVKQAAPGQASKSAKQGKGDAEKGAEGKDPAKETPKKEQDELRRIFNTGLLGGLLPNPKETWEKAKNYRHGIPAAGNLKENGDLIKKAIAFKNKEDVKDMKAKLKKLVQS